MRQSATFFLALLAVIIMCKLAYRSGLQNGEQGLGYWQGWQDAMIQTEYGTKPVEGKFNLK